jgi:RND family efflux transporter MFP subunit
VSTVSVEETLVMVDPSIQDRVNSPRVISKPPADERPPTRRWRWLVILALLAVVGAGAWYAYPQVASMVKNKTAAAGNGAEKGQRASKATLGFATEAALTAGGSKPSRAAGPIATVPVEVVQRSDILRLTGTLVADERSSVASNTSGIVAEVRVDRGSLVRKNDILVQIDPTDAKNKLTEGRAMLDELKARLGLDEKVENFNPEDEPEVRTAKAQADLAASNLKRAREMFAKKVISTEAFDATSTEHELAMQRYRQSLFQIKQAFQTCKTAQAKLAILEKAVADTTIRAPFDGWVAEKLVAVGEQISSGMQATKVITLVRINPLRLSLTVPQHNIGCIQPGQTVRFQVDSFPDHTFDATVRFIAPVVTNDTRSMVVEAVVPNPDGALRPGLFATAELMLPKRGSQVFAPLSAVQKMGEVARVFVVRDGLAREQVVALGDVDNGKVEIVAGLTGKERLVAKPELVHDGDAVR